MFNEDKKVFRIKKHPYTISEELHGAEVRAERLTYICN